MKAPLETLYLLYKRNRIKAISLWPDGKKQSHARKTAIIFPAYGFLYEEGWEQAVLSKGFHTGSRG